MKMGLAKTDKTCSYLAPTNHPARFAGHHPWNHMMREPTAVQRFGDWLVDLKPWQFFLLSVVFGSLGSTAITVGLLYWMIG